MSKYKDALRILRHRLAFFRGEVPEAGGKKLMERVLKSENTERVSRSPGSVPGTRCICQRVYICSMSKYKDALRILRHRLAFFRGEVPEAGGKKLMERVLKSEKELSMLQTIENMYEPTTYHRVCGMHVDYITPDVCDHIRLIYKDKGLDNDEGGDHEAHGQKASDDPDSVRGGESKHKRLKVGTG